MKPTAEQTVQWFFAATALGMLLFCFFLYIGNGEAIYTFDAAPETSSVAAADSEVAIGDGKLRERFRSGLLFRQTPDGQEVLFDGTVAAAIRWTAIAVCMTVGGSVIIVFLSLLRPFIRRE